jgi:hypothetical protein
MRERTDKLELEDTGDDIVDDFRKAKRPAHMPREMWDKMMEEIEHPKQHLGIRKEAEVNGIPKIIWESWEYADANDRDLWEFCDNYEAGKEYGDGRKDAIEWTRKQLKKFKGILERFANNTARASDLKEIVNKFDIKMEVQTARVDGEVKFIELRSYKQAVDPELERFAAKHDPPLKTMDTRYSPFLFFLYTALYDFLIRDGKKLGVCSASDCRKLYIPTPRGRNQQYCSDRCYKRIYTRKRRRRLKEEAGD